MLSMKYRSLLLYMNSYPNLDTHLLRPIVLLYEKSYCNLIPPSLEWSHSQCRNCNIWKKHLLQKQNSHTWEWESVI